MKNIVLDNSVLSAFAKTGRFNILRRILKDHKIYIADTVLREIIFQEIIDAVTSDKKDLGDRWIIVEKVDIEDIKEPNIDEGEAGTVKLALKKKATAVIDDLDGRRFASKHKVEVIGTLALLKNSQHKGIISRPELESILKDLETKDGFRMTKELKEWILK